MKKIVSCFFILVIIFEASSFVHNCSAVPTPSVVINEVAWMGTTISANNEWIELLNTTENDIDLNGWTLKSKDGVPEVNLSGVIFANGYYLLERTSDDTVSGVTADLIYQGALSNGGEALELHNSQNELIDIIDATSGWPAGENDTKATMERKSDGSFLTSNIIGGTPKTSNSVEGNNSGSSDPKATSTPSGTENNQSSTTTPNPGNNTNNNTSSSSYPEIIYNKGDVVINEFCSDPDASEVEWVELYNSTNQDIDMSGWTIEEGSGSKTIVTGKLTKDGPGKFMVIEKPKGNLNNSGDIIILNDNKGNVIDIVTYGNWNDGNLDNNAPAAGNPYSVARKYDGLDTVNDRNDFAVTTRPTKGESNIIVESVEESPAVASATSNPAPAVNNENVSLTEILPDPSGDDAEKEFIELYNKGGNDVDLTGWIIEVRSTKYEIGSQKSNVESRKSKIINAGGYYIIFRKESGLILDNSSDTVKLYQPGKKTALQSVAYKGAAEGYSYSYSRNAQRVTHNGIIENRSGSDWEWSKVVTPGKANIIDPRNNPPVIDAGFPDKIIAGVPALFDASDSYDIDHDILKFKWYFGDGAISETSSPSHIYSDPGSYKITLVVSDGVNNTAKEKSYKVIAFDLSQPGNNIYNQKMIKASVKSKIKKTAKAKVTKKAVKIKKTASKSSSGKKIVKTVKKTNLKPVGVSLEKINEAIVGTKVITEGTVAVRPGVLGTQYFYIVGSPGIQVYNYKKLFPKLREGDKVEVHGEIGESAGERRIKTSKIEDIKILSHKNPLVPKKLTGEDLNSEHAIRLVEINGEITKKLGSTIYLDDGTDESLVYIKKYTGITMKDYKEGDNIQVTGILGFKQLEQRIFPRSQNDIVKIAQAANGSINLTGEVATSSEWELQARDKKLEFLRYILVVSGGIILVLGVWVFKKYKTP